MKKRVSNILICVLAVVAIGCGIMAAGTIGGWFGGDTVSQETVQAAAQQGDTQQTEATQEEGEQDSQAGSSKNDEAKSKDNNGGNGTCTISIKCTSVLKNMDKLSSGKAKYVPSNGIILATSTIEFKAVSYTHLTLPTICSV